MLTFLFGHLVFADGGVAGSSSGVGGGRWWSLAYVTWLTEFQ